MEFLGNVVPFVSEMPKVQNTEGKEVAPDVNGPESLYLDVYKRQVDYLPSRVGEGEGSLLVRR